MADAFDLFIDSSCRRLGAEAVLAAVSGRLLVRTAEARTRARAQFGCAGLEGAALENEGDGGSAASHWESRLFQARAAAPLPLPSLFAALSLDSSPLEAATELLLLPSPEPRLRKITRP
jgi:hypothetical protein